MTHSRLFTFKFFEKIPYIEKKKKLENYLDSKLASIKKKLN
jgi:hypothetical protein